MSDLDPYLLRAFLAVSGIGTVSGAAQALNRTQAAVSMQIRKLEQLVGSELFVRSSRGLDMTADGELLLPYAREMIAMNDEISRRMSKKGVVGRVRLGVVEDFAATRMIQILQAFRDQNPGIDIDIIVEPNRRLAGLFEQEQLDIAAFDASITTRKPLFLWQEKLLWATRSDIGVNENEPLRAIMFSESCPWRGPALSALAQCGLPWTIACEASTLVAMVAAVRIGIGIGPMLAATIPQDCRALDTMAGFPSPVRIAIGLYSRNGAPEGARHLADFIMRHADVTLMPPSSQRLAGIDENL